MRRGSVFLLTALVWSAGCVGPSAPSTSPDSGLAITADDFGANPDPSATEPPPSAPPSNIPAPTGTPSSIPPSSQAASDGTLPIILVHGYDSTGDAGNDGTQWNQLISQFQAWGWTGPFSKWAYYGCDQGVGGQHDASRYGKGEGGSHVGDTLYGGSEFHEGYYACGQGNHDRYTPIMHLAYHLAWGIHKVYGHKGGCVSAIGHSMGGLILRYAVVKVELRDPDFPPSLCIQRVVTLGTPHKGALEPGTWQDCVTEQCREMQPDHDFINWLSSYAVNPQGTGGTRWIVIGSEDDWLVSSQSATSMTAWQLVSYLYANRIHHTDPPSYMYTSFSATTDGYRSFAANDLTAHVRYQIGGPALPTCLAPWPAFWAFKSLRYDDASWMPASSGECASSSPSPTSGPNTGPFMDWADPQSGSYSRTTSQAFDVEVECGDDPQGDNVYVDFYSGNTVLGTLQDTYGSSPDFSYSFSSAGTQNLKARCRDSQGAYASPNDAAWTVSVSGSGTTLANNKYLAIPAESYARHQFSLSGSAGVDYSFARQDSSTLDIGLIRDSDWSTYSSGGSVTTYSYHSQVGSASDSTTLSAGSYDLVFYCWNTTFDCDINYSLSYT